MAKQRNHHSLVDHENLAHLLPSTKLMIIAKKNSQTAAPANAPVTATLIKNSARFVGLASLSIGSSRGLN